MRPPFARVINVVVISMFGLVFIPAATEIAGGRQNLIDFVLGLGLIGLG